MTTDIEVLDAIKKLLKDNLKDIKLEKNNNDDKYELVNPAIYSCWVPPKNCLHEYDYDIPVIVICHDKGKEDGENVSLNIRLNIQTYDPGFTSEGNTIPNYKGYTDILNLITKIRLILNESPSKIGIIVEKPIEWGFYDEQIYPYYAGYMTFAVRTNLLPIAQSLNEFL